MEELKQNQQVNNKMTTEEFHALLAENTEKMNQEREVFIQGKIEARKRYDALMRTSDQKMKQLREKKNEFNKSVAEVMAAFDLDERNIGKFRREAREDYERDLCRLKGKNAIANESIAAKRHDLFEAYRNSGGAIYGRLNLFAASRMDQKNQRTR